jgi:adenylate kinase family enzyme
MKLRIPLLFAWYPWCWKWTQGRLFEQNIWSQHIDSWATLRRLLLKISTPKDVVKIIERWYTYDWKKDIWLRRDLQSIILEENNWDWKNKNVIFDGFWRDSIGLQLLHDIVWDVNFIHFIISQELSLERMKKRWEREGDVNERFRHGRIYAFDKRTAPLIQKARSNKRALQLRVESLDIQEVQSLLIEKLIKIWILINDDNNKNIR